MAEGTARKGGRLRVKVANQTFRVTNVELFFDLVFVFAITQISHTLTEHYGLLGAVQMLFVLLAVWWVWMYTAWVTNWLDPDHVSVRAMLFVLMLAGLVMSAAIPDAFHGGQLFGITYAFMQVARTAFMYQSVPSADRNLKRNFARILCWLTLSAVLWIAGSLFDGTTRFALWLAALVIEYVSPYVRFWVPGMGASQVEDWNIDGAHLAERCGLFVIIVLGESVLVTGATFAKTSPDAIGVAAFVIAFAGSIAMWWIYFDRGAESGAHLISHAADPGRLARLAYTYLHLPIVAGVVVTAVADDFLLAHPAQAAQWPAALSIVGGPFLFLAGTVCFKRCIRGWYQPSHLVGMAALAAVFAATLAGVAQSQLVLGAICVGILVVVAAWERLSLGRGQAHAA